MANSSTSSQSTRKRAREATRKHDRSILRGTRCTRTPIALATRRHVPRVAIKSSLGRTRTKRSCGRARFKEPFAGTRLGPGGPRRGGAAEREKGGGSIRGDSIGLLHPAGSRRGPAGARAAAWYLIWPLSEPRVAVFWPGIVLRGFTFISILITRSLGSRFGTRYPSSPYTHTLPSLSLPSFPPRSFSPRCCCFSLVPGLLVFLLVRGFGQRDELLS